MHQPPIAKRGRDTEWLRERPPLTFFLLLQAIEREILNCQGHSTRLKVVSALGVGSEAFEQPREDLG